MLDIGEAIALQQHAQPHGPSAPDLASAGSGPPTRRMGPPKAIANGGRHPVPAAAGERERQEGQQQLQDEDLEDGEVPEEGEVPMEAAAASHDVGGSQRAGWQPGGHSSYRCVCSAPRLTLCAMRSSFCCQHICAPVRAFSTKHAGRCQHGHAHPGVHGCRDGSEYPYASVDASHMYGYGGGHAYQQHAHQNGGLPYDGWRDHDAMPQHPFELAE